MQKRIVVSIAILSLALVMLTAMPKLNANPDAIIHVAPAAISNAVVGQDYTVDINVTDVADLYGWEFQLSYDQTIVHLTSTSIVAGGLNTPTQTYQSVTDDAHGHLWWAVSTTHPTATGIAYAEHAIFEIVFHAIAAGTCNLHLSGTILSDHTGAAILHTDADGVIYVQNLTLTVTTNGSGTVVLNDTGPYYYFDEAVQLNATPATGWSFSSWSGNLTGSANPATLTIIDNMIVTATFTQNHYALTVKIVGTGLVNLNNTGPYQFGDVVQLSAVPAAGWGFASWSGDLSGSDNPATLAVISNMVVTATFTQNVYTLTVTVSPVGSGGVSLSGTGPYHYGDAIELTATPAADWSFQYWSGDLSGSANVTTIIMTADLSVTAHFINKPTLQMSPTSKTCRVYHENFTVAITVSSAANFKGFTFEIDYNTILLNYVSVTWGIWGSGSASITVDEATGKITVSNSGTPISGTQTLVTINFTVSLRHIFKYGTSENPWTNDLIDTIYFQSISMSYPVGQDLNYQRGDSTQISVGPDFAYTFSPIQGDLDNNGIVDIFDLRTVAAYFGTSNPTYDLNNDGTIDVADIQIVAYNYDFTYHP